MVKLTEIQNEQLREIMKNIKIPEKHKANVFWCPKVITTGTVRREGVILYVYGGHILDIYAKQSSLGASIFSKKYCHYFKTEKRGKEIRDKFITANKKKNGIDVLEGWSEEIWDEICNACLKWATKEKNSEYERMRQTRICNDSMENSEFTVFTMEEKIFIDGKQPEMDIIAIRQEKEEVILSYIEYKCTESAMKGKCSIPKHYEAMAKISVIDDNIERMLELYYQKQRMLGKRAELLNAKTCRQEIVFLISNIQWKDSVNKREARQYVSAKTLYNKLDETSKRRDFRDADVKVIIMDDIDVDSNNSYLLNAKKMMTVNEAIKVIREKMNEDCE